MPLLPVARAAAFDSSAVLAGQPCDPPQQDAPRSQANTGPGGRVPKEVPDLAGERVGMIDGAYPRGARLPEPASGCDSWEGRSRRDPATALRFGVEGADPPLKTVRAGLVEQVWQRGQLLTVMSDGVAALPNLMRAATGEPVRHILDGFYLSIGVRPIGQVLLGLAACRLADPEPVQAAQASIDRIFHRLWHGRQEQADQERVLLLSHGLEMAGS